MIQTYRIFLALPDKPIKSYVGLCFGDGITAESRMDDELSLRKPPNKSFRAAVEEHTRYAFESEVTGTYDTLLDALHAEAEQIEKYKSWHNDFGWNRTRGIDKKRLAKAQAEYVPTADVESLLAAAWIDFRANHSEAWTPYDTPANVKLVSDLAVDEKISIASAFQRLVESGAIALAVTTA